MYKFLKPFLRICTFLGGFLGWYICTQGCRLYTYIYDHAWIFLEWTCVYNTSLMVFCVEEFDSIRSYICTYGNAHMRTQIHQRNRHILGARAHATWHWYETLSWRNHVRGTQNSSHTHAPAASGCRWQRGRTHTCALQLHFQKVVGAIRESRSGCLRRNDFVDLHVAVAGVWYVISCVILCLCTGLYAAVDFFVFFNWRPILVCIKVCFVPRVGSFGRHTDLGGMTSR